MEFLAWFGKVDRESGSIFPADDTDEMIETLLLPKVELCPSPQPDLRAMAKVCGFVESDQDYNSRLRGVALGLVRRQLKALTGAEQDLLQAVEALDDLNQALNLLDERLYEWSRLRRQEIAHGRDLAEALSDDEITGKLARAILRLRDTWEAMEKEVGLGAERIAPNLSLLAGPVLAARLISRAGSLRRLSEMPSSTLQVMGAEKALFKHLKGNAPSPKHGIIYRHPAVIGAPKRLRGKAARALAGKLAIAARMDYNGAGIFPDLKSSLEKRLADIKSRGRKAPLKKD